VAVAAQTEPVFEAVNGFEPHFVMPSGTRMVSIKDPAFGAAGDGQTDDTEAFKRAIEYNQPRTIYLPAGTYLIRDQLRYGAQDRKKKRTLLIGERRSSTVIRLAEGSPGFDDPGNPKVFIHTRKGSQQGEQNMHMYLYHLTIEIGKNNPGAVALNFHTNNTGAVKDVTIRAEDPVNHPGFRGIAFDDYWFGPGNARYLEIDGFRQGVYVGAAKNHTTLEHVLIRNCRVGLYQHNHTVSARKITTVDCDTAIVNKGRLALIDGSFGGGEGGAAIYNEGGLLARRIETRGYDAAIDGEGGRDIQGYCSQEAIFNWAPPDEMTGGLDLPVAESPEMQYPRNEAEWAVIGDGGDITDDLRRAISRGAAHIFVQGGTITATINVPSTVKRIMGLGVVTIAQKTGADPAFRIEEEADEPFMLELVYQDYGSTSRFALEHGCGRTVVFRHGSGGYRSTGSAAGAHIFMESVVGYPIHFTGVDAWVRDLNTEQGGPDHVNVLNDGATLWILGHKTEDWATKIATVNEGRTELLLGAFRQNWDASDFEHSGIDPGDPPPLFVIDNAQASLSFATWASGGPPAYRVLVRETRDGETREIVHSAHGGCCGGGQMIFAGYAQSAATQAPRGPNLQRNHSSAASITGLTSHSITLQATKPMAVLLSVATINGRIVAETTFRTGIAGTFRAPLFRPGRELAAGLYAVTLREQGESDILTRKYVCRD
jgi:hypothetical protein